MAVLVLRQKVTDYLKIHQYRTALYWADKAVCLSNGDPKDVIDSVECMFHLGEYQRIISYLSKYDFAKKSLYARYIMSQCYYKCEDYVEALNVLEDDDCFSDHSCKCSLISLIGYSSKNTIETAANRCENIAEVIHTKSVNLGYLPPSVTEGFLKSNIALHRGRLYEAMNNQNLAIQLYQEAFKLDPLCFESFEKLCDLGVNPLSDSKYTNLNESFLDHKVVPILISLYTDKLSKQPSVKNFNFPLESAALLENADVLVNKAERLLNVCHYGRCYSITNYVIDKDPYHPGCLPIHIAVLKLLNKSNELFQLSNRLVKVSPDNAVSWFAVGCYYLLARKYELAKRHLRKATQQDRKLGPAWLALGHTYSASNEHDQAISTYCTAAQVTRGSHIPIMYIGIEYSASFNHNLAEKFLLHAKSLSPNDPFVLHELGTIAFKTERYVESLELLKMAHARARELSEQVLAPFWEPLLNNLGHVYRELGQYEESLKMHSAALNLVENSPTSLEAMGLIYAITHRIEEAIRVLQTAIYLHACRSDANFASELLKTCIKQNPPIIEKNKDFDENFQPGRDIIDSPPPDAFPPIISVGVTKTNAVDVDVVFNLNPSTDIQLSTSTKKDITMLTK